MRPCRSPQDCCTHMQGRCELLCFTNHKHGRILFPNPSIVECSSLCAHTCARLSRSCKPPHPLLPQPSHGHAWCPRNRFRPCTGGALLPLSLFCVFLWTQTLAAVVLHSISCHCEPAAICDSHHMHPPDVVGIRLPAQLRATRARPAHPSPPPC